MSSALTPQTSITRQNWLRRIAPPLLNLAYEAGIYRALSTIYGGLGLIFSLHRVVEPNSLVLQPHHLLRSDILTEVLATLRKLDWDIVSVQEISDRISGRGPRTGRRFACFTFDDGYADSLTLALPIFREYQAPLCVYVTTGIVERSIFYWWGANHELIVKSDSVEVPSLTSSQSTILPGQTFEQKWNSYQKLNALCHQWGDSFTPTLRELYKRNSIDPDRCLDREALSIDQLQELASDPLVTIGSHCVTHQRLSQMHQDEMWFELDESRRKLEVWLGLEIRHLAYSFGRSDACGIREFQAARKAGFDTAVTTRQGNLFPQHREHLLCLPRRSIPVTRLGLLNALFGVETILRKESRVQLA